MLKIQYQSRFKKDYKKMKQRGYDESKLKEVISLLVNQQQLPEKHKDHQLIGNYAGCRECHIAPDWLLIYEVREDELILLLMSTGTHSDLF